MICEGQIVDAKTLIALQNLHLCQSV